MAATGISRISPRIVLSFALALLAGTAGADAQNAPPDPAQAAAQQQHDQQVAGFSVAERLIEVAQENLIGPVDNESLRQSATLIEAATRLVPKEPRYFRLLAAVRMQLHDVPGEIAAWSAYRQLEPGDRVAQVRLIELYATQMQTADQREKYLNSLLDRAGIPNEVKSAVATESARLLLNRSESDASAMVDRAVKFYPLPEALMLQYQLLDKKASASTRFRGLLTILQADPTEVDALSAAAELLSEQQLNAEAKDFFSTAVGCLERDAIAPPHSLLIDYVACLYLSGSDMLAKQWASSILVSVPGDVDFHFLNLTILKHGSDALPDDAVSAARDALAQRWTQVNNAILDMPQQAPDAGQPVVAPDPMDAANKLAKASPSPQTQRLKNAFIGSMVDLAWLELYYANKPQDAQRWIDALKAVAPADAPQLLRLEGWYALKSQNFDQAIKAFSSVKGNDVLSQLGLVLVARSQATPQTLQRALVLKQKLLSTHYDGLLDAILHQALAPEAPVDLPADLPAPLRPASQPATGPATQPGNAQSPEAVAMIAAIKQFPPAWLSFSTHPEQFYTLHLTPLTTSCRYGQPIMAMVSITNVGNFDLPIGALGPLLPTVVYGGEAMGANTGPAWAYGSLTDRLVLRPTEEVDEVVRLDQGALAAYLQGSISPGLALITGDVYTNPVILKDKVDVGAGGQHGRTDQLIGRQIPDLMNAAARAQFYHDLQTGTPDVRIDSLDLLWATSRWLHKHTQSQDDLRRSDEFLTVIDHYAADQVSVVADWAKYRAATLSRPDSDKLIHGLMTDKDWLTRVLSMLAMSNEPYPIRRRMTAAMVHDSDPIVKALADATLARLTAAATQPAPADQSGAATQPATLPESP